MKEQLLKYKPLLISTTVIIISEVSRFILTFTLACMRHSRQRYMYLAGYLISYLLLIAILFIYIISSPKYKNQLGAAIKALRLPFFRRA